MGLSDLPYLTERRPMAVPKPKTRAEMKDAANKADENALNIWRVRIFQRDGGKCRCCGRKVKKTLENIPLRAEAHHLVSRKDHALRYDVRNGILLCQVPCHHGVTIGKIGIAQPARLMFSFEGKSYIDGSEPVEWIR